VYKFVLLDGLLKMKSIELVYKYAKLEHGAILLLECVLPIQLQVVLQAPGLIILLTFVLVTVVIMQAMGNTSTDRI
jgi:hypothetical protein